MYHIYHIEPCENECEKFSCEAPQYDDLYETEKEAFLALAELVVEKSIANELDSEWVARRLRENATVEWDNSGKAYFFTSWGYCLFKIERVGDK